MTLEPTPRQRAGLEEVSGPVGLLTFLAPVDGASLERYLASTNKALKASGGKRQMLWSIDQVLSGEPLSFTFAVLDRFPDASSALRAHDALVGEREAEMSEMYAVALRVNRVAPVVTRMIASLSPVLRRFVHIDESKSIDPELVLTPPRIHATTAQLEELRSHDQTRPFYNINLTVFRDRDADQDDIVRRIYRPSGLKLFAFGGYVAATGDVLGTLVGNSEQSLHGDWESCDIALWPSRAALQTYWANASRDLADARKTYLKRVVQLTCSKR